MATNGVTDHDSVNGHTVQSSQGTQEAQVAFLSADANEAITGINKISKSNFSTEYERASAKEAAYDLLTRLETPHELLRRLFSWDPALAACLGACHEMQLFQKWRQNGPSESKSCTQLSELTRCNLDLLRRILRHISAHGVLEYSGNDVYKMGETAQAFGEAPAIGVIPHGLEMRYAGARNFPIFLKSINFSNPIDSAKTNWEHLTGLKAYPWIIAEPQRTQDFQNSMQAYNKSKPEWVDFYPTSTLLEGSKPDRPIFVDMGGGQGHDLEALRQRHPDLPKGSLVLQDRKEVVEQNKLHYTIDQWPHDFFAEQTIRGARAYYMHCVLHDWADADAEKILKQITPAMERGYSKLLLHDVVVQEFPSRMETSSDLQMMMLAVGRDRTEGDLRALLKRAGLKLSKVWTTPLGPESIVEAVVPDEGEEY